MYAKLSFYLTLTTYLQPSGCKKLLIQCWSLNSESYEMLPYTHYPPRDDEAQTLADMLDSQVLDSDNKPLIALSSARIADPGIKPSETQSMILVITQSEFMDTPSANIQAILRDRCVLVLPRKIMPGPGFNVNTLSRYGHPHGLTVFQGMAHTSTEACFTKHRPDYDDNRFVLHPYTLVGKTFPAHAITPLPDINIAIPPRW